MTDMWEEQSILKEADKLVSEDRQDIYGHPYDDFSRATEMYQPILESNLDPALKHALIMIQVKISRLLNTPYHHDTIVDIAGYAKCYKMIADKLDKA
jgi:hypothetical protein